MSDTGVNIQINPIVPDIQKKKYEKLQVLRRKLDKEIGYNYWKKYVAAAFWSQISTPINLTITFLTAITTAQAQSDSLIPHSVYAQIAIISLVITTLNTFFRPHTQYAANTEYLSKWKSIGIEFEQEYFNRMEDESVETYDLKIKAYSELQEQVDDLRKTEGTDTINFLTDFIYYIAYRTCLTRYKLWLDMDRRIISATQVEIVRQGIDKEKKEADYRVQVARIKKQEEYEMGKIKENKESEGGNIILTIRQPDTLHS